MQLTFRARANSRATVEREQGDHRVEERQIISDPDGDNENTFEEPNFRNETRSFYSPELLNLVERCTSWAVDDRPDFRTILDTCIRHTTPGTCEYRSGGLRDAVWTDTRFGHHMYGLFQPGVQNCLLMRELYANVGDQPE